MPGVSERGRRVLRSKAQVLLINRSSVNKAGTWQLARLALALAEAQTAAHAESWARQLLAQTPFNTAPRTPLMLRRAPGHHAAHKQGCTGVARGAALTGQKNRPRSAPRGEKLAGLPTIRGGEGQRYYDGRGKRRSIYTTVPAAAVGVYTRPCPTLPGSGFCGRGSPRREPSYTSIIPNPTTHYPYNAPLPRIVFVCSTFRVCVPEYPPWGRPSS